ncbi:MAG: hypothetical protein IJ550_06330, partial [Bacteroidaceae bacterium]|nr:hypothetical protein [Bacteroidaceae bacterium]
MNRIFFFSLPSDGIEKKKDCSIGYYYCPLNISLMEKFRAETFFRCQPFWLPLLSPNKIKRNHGQKYTFFR